MSRKTYSAAVTSNMTSTSQPIGNSSTPATIDAYHPYFLQSSDNPGIPLVTQPLNAQNYQQWSRSIRLALSAKNKLGLIDGTLPKPAEDSNMFSMWTPCNDMVLSWLLNSISCEIRDSVVYFATTKEIWEDLAIRFSQGNVPRIFQLKKDLTALNQGTMSITAYFTKIRTLTDELNALAPLPKCICVSNTCSCGVSAKLEAYEQINSLSQFLMGLNDVFTSIRGQILLMKPLPTLSQAYFMLLQEENQRSSHNSQHLLETTAMNVKVQSNKSKQNFPKKSDNSEVCDYCHNSGHIREKCFFLHGYPDWHRLHGKPKPKLKQFGNSAGTTKVANVTSTVSAEDNVSTKSDSKDVFTTCKNDTEQHQIYWFLECFSLIRYHLQCLYSF